MRESGGSLSSCRDKLNSGLRRNYGKKEREANIGEKILSQCSVDRFVVGSGGFAGVYVDRLWFFWQIPDG